LESNGALLKNKKDPVSQIRVNKVLKEKIHKSKCGFEVVCSEIDLTIGCTTILDGVSGVFKSGEVTALMGPTGSGKTSLLKCIGHRVAHKGCITYGGNKWSKAMRRRTAFVEQTDIIWEKLTVNQTLLFTARLRVDLKQEELAARVEDVIQILRLTKCRDTKVGVCSGGEKRRVSIAKELLTDPRIMLLDEVTSGLDSTMALVVAETITEVAKRDQLVVIMSIHQPNSNIYELMDSLYLMDMKGNVRYKGPAIDAVEHFRLLGHACPSDYNPPDFFMELLVLEKLGNASAKEKKMIVESTAPPCDKADTESSLYESRHERYHLSWLQQFQILAERDWIISTDSFITKTSVFLNMGEIFIKIGLFWQLSFEESTVLPHFAALLWIFGTFLFFSTMGAIGVFHAEHDQVEKELQVGAYRLSAFFVAKNLVHLVLGMFWPTITLPFTIFCMYDSEIYTDYPYKICLFWCVTLMTVMSMQGIGFLIGTGFQIDKAFTIGILAITFEFAMSGFFNKLQSWLSWILWVNVFIPTLTLGGVVLWLGNTWSCDYPSDFEKCPEKEITQHDLLSKFFPMYMPYWFLAFLYIIACILLFRILSFRLLRVRMSKNIAN